MDCFPLPPSACRKPWILATPTYHPCHPFLQPTLPSPPPGLLDVDAAFSSGHRPLGCMCMLVRWRCFMVSWCDRAGAGWRACDSDFCCPPPDSFSEFSPSHLDPKCVNCGTMLRVCHRLSRLFTHHPGHITNTRTLFLPCMSFIQNYVSLWINFKEGRADWIAQSSASYWSHYATRLTAASSSFSG